VRAHVKATLVAVICLSAWPLLAADGVLIVEKTTTAGKTQTSQVQIEKDRMRADTIGAAGEKQAIIFDGIKQVMSMINYDRKVYNEMTQADVDRMGGQMTAAMAQMQEQMKSMPPAQRAQIEAMMRGRGAAGMGAAQAPKTEYKKVGTDKAGRWTCDKYEGHQGTQKVSEVCTVEPAALGFALADFAVTKQLAEFFKKLSPQSADSVFAIGTPEAQGFSGVPVRRITFRNGQPQTTTELTDVTRQAFAASTFAVPAGFQKEAFGGRGR
jgi:Domain of unknown function (DUF4412)